MKFLTFLGKKFTIDLQRMVLQIFYIFIITNLQQNLLGKAH